MNGSGHTVVAFTFLPFDTFHPTGLTVFVSNSEKNYSRLILMFQSWTKYLQQSKEINQNWTGAENLDNCFCESFDRYYKSFIAGRKTGNQAISLLNFDFLLIFPNFLRS